MNHLSDSENGTQVFQVKPFALELLTTPNTEPSGFVKIDFNTGANISKHKALPQYSCLLRAHIKVSYNKKYNFSHQILES